MALEYYGSAVSFRMFGVASSPQNLINVENDSGSGKYVGLYQWKLLKDMLTLQNALAPIARLTTPTGTRAGGADMQIGKVAAVGTDTMPSSVRFRHCSSADGTASAITGLTAGTTLKHEAQPLKMVSMVGILVNADPNILPGKCNDDPWIVPPGESLLCQMVNSGVAGTASVGDQYYSTIVFKIGTAIADFA